MDFKIDDEVLAPVHKDGTYVALSSKAKDYSWATIINFKEGNAEIALKFEPDIRFVIPSNLLYHYETIGNPYQFSYYETPKLLHYLKEASKQKIVHNHMQPLLEKRSEEKGDTVVWLGGIEIYVDIVRVESIDCITLRPMWYVHDMSKKYTTTEQTIIAAKWAVDCFNQSVEGEFWASYANVASIMDVNEQYKELP